MNCVSISGKWKFALDPRDEGLSGEWWGRRDVFQREIDVPGAWQARGYGDNRYCTLALQASGIPPMVAEKTSYLGTGWYQREIVVPAAWRGKTIRAAFGGTHPRAEIWIDEHFVSMHEGSFLEHVHDITSYVTPGRKHTLTVRISEFEHTVQSGKRDWHKPVEGGIFNAPFTWSGIYRDVKLQAKNSSWIECVLITPDIEKCRAKFKIRFGGAPVEGLRLRFSVAGPGGEKAGEIETPAASCPETAVPLNDVKLWDPENPHLYRAAVSLVGSSGETVDEAVERFGMREFSVDGQHIKLNGQAVFLRGYGDNQLYVDSLSPCLDRKMLEKDIRQAKDYGFNYANFLYGIPHREYLDAADELGFIVQCYPTNLYADPEYISRVIGQIYNHPSVGIYSVAAEKWGCGPKKAIEKSRKITADIDSTRLFSTTGGIDRASADRDVTDILEMMLEFCNTPEKLNVCRKPVLLHEYYWWSSYPDSRLKSRYEQSAMRPFFIEFAEKIAREKHMEHLLPVFVANSQKLQALERKVGVERARRNPGIQGYAIWMGKDYKEATEGIWDDFGEPKNVSAGAFRESNGETVLLIDREFDFRCYWSYEDIPIEMWLSHYGKTPISGGEISWRLNHADNGELLDEGHLGNISCPAGTSDRAARFRVSPRAITSPSQVVLEANLEAAGVSVSNRWDFWLFPPIEGGAATGRRGPDGQVRFPGGASNISGGMQDIRICGEINDSFLECLNNGGRVLLLASKIFGEERVEKFPRSIPWNKDADGQSGTVIADHPALGDFPHKGYCDLQFFEMLNRSRVMDLDRWPARIEPIIRAISSYKVCRNLGYLFEIRAGRGSVLITTMNLATGWDEDFQMPSVAREYLMCQLKKYVAGGEFKPASEVPLSFLKQFSTENA